MKKTNGITLIALVITIIVLLILAGVTIVTLTGDNGLLTKAGEARNTNINAENMEKIKLAYQDYYLGKHTQTGYTLKNALDKTFGENIVQVTGEGPWTITIGDRTYSLESNGTVTPNSSGGGSSTSVAYEVGDVVRLGGEDFYVIERSDETKTTVKLLAKYNVKTTAGEGQYTQRADANTLAFNRSDEDASDYETSALKIHGDAYKTALETRMGKTIEELRIMTVEEVDALGGNSSTSNAWGNALGCPAFIYSQNYWLGTMYEFENCSGWWVICSNGNFDCWDNYSDHLDGFRPVVIVLKSDI